MCSWNGCTNSVFAEFKIKIRIEIKIKIKMKLIKMNLRQIKSWCLPMYNNTLLTQDKKITLDIFRAGRSFNVTLIFQKK